jgi:hypothetical protein
MTSLAQALLAKYEARMNRAFMGFPQIRLKDRGWILLILLDSWMHFDFIFGSNWEKQRKILKNGRGYERTKSPTELELRRKVPPSKYSTTDIASYCRNIAYQNQEYRKS